MIRDERALSTTLGYAMTLGIATVLVTSLLVAGGTMLQDHRQDVTRSTLEVISQQFVSDLVDAGILASEISNTSFTYTAALPERAVGAGYTMTLTADADPQTSNGYVLTVTSDHGGIDVTVTIQFVTPVGIATPVDVKGGPVAISYDSSGSGKLEVGP